MFSDIRTTTIEKIKWILNSTGAVFEVVKDQTRRDKRSPVWLDGKSQRQACCSCYWWYVTLEPHVSFINTSKEAVRSDTVNRKSRPMTICLHVVWLWVPSVYFQNRGKGGPVSSACLEKMLPVVNANLFTAPYRKQVRTPRFSKWDKDTQKTLSL